MRHLVRTKKLGKDAKHKKSLLRNLASVLFETGRVQTTIVKAKELRSFAEKLISRARTDTVHHRRMVAKSLPRPQVVKILFDDIGKRYVNRPGGYTRLIKIGMRKGDGSEMCYLELTPEKLSIETEDKDNSKKAVKSDDMKRVSAKTETKKEKVTATASA